jgi:sulfatase maturation enzyme AslB (radical SAM superfamily)
MSFATVEKALPLFLPFFTDFYYLNFYGGEPLLCFDLIKQTVSFIDKTKSELHKTAQYSITTNGSLMTEETLRFLDNHEFSVIYSFDGLAQNIHRRDGNFDDAVSNIQKALRHPQIQLEVNSVFTPDTVDLISESMELMMNLGVKKINLSPSMLRPWGQDSLDLLKIEMAKLRKILEVHCKKLQEVPIVSFQKDDSEGFFYCAGGQDRMAITSEEHVWGCDLFADYFRGKENLPEYNQYFFGDLDTFAKTHKKALAEISSNYAKLGMDNFSAPNRPCLFCSNLENCTVCPISATFGGAPIGEIPSFVCEIQKIRIGEQKKFWEEVQS